MHIFNYKCTVKKTKSTLGISSGVGLAKSRQSNESQAQAESRLGLK
jgi:hypothetical protein